MPAPVLQIRRGNAGVAGTVPALRPGEPAISLNNFDFFIGIDTSVTNNKFFGSHRYWEREESGVKSLKLKLVSDNGVQSVNLAAPTGLGATVTYTFPSTPTAGYYLKTASDGTLSWSEVSQNSFAGIVTFTDTTDNTLGNTNTGSVQIDGGLGVDKNVSIGAGLSVTGQSYFIGTATFYGGSITLGDNDTDSISIGGRFASNLVPTTDNAYDVGISTLNWRNAYFSGIGTFETGAVVDGVQIGITGANVIDTVSGNLTLNSAGGTTIIDDAVTIQNNLTVNGNVTVGGTTITLRGQDVYIENKDIILGYTTSITPNDDTANHAGVAIASTVGTPLVSFDASGINTLPNTYKQLMWFKSGTLGFTTDAFAFNYGLAIGTTTMANGVRLAVGSGITMSDNTITATTINATTANITNLSGNLTGTISTATRATTIDVTENDTSTGSILFAVGTGATSILRDNDLTFNAITNTLTTQNGVFTGNVGIGTTNPQTKLQVNGTISFPIYDNSSAPGGWNPTLLVGSNILIGDSTTGSKLTPTSTVYGFNNTFIGVGAGSSATTSYINNFVGKYSGRYTTTGSANNFFGNNSGYNNVTGFSNNFFGSQSGYENTSGVYNSFYGIVSGYYNTTASSNSFFGGGSGFYNTIGSYNSFFGNHAGLYNQTGSYNLFLGSYSGISTSASNKVLIGVGKSWSATGVFDAPDTTKSTQFAVGVRTDANPSKYWLVGNENFNVGIGTTNPTTKLEINGVLGFSDTNVKFGDNTVGANLTSGTNNIFMGVGAGSSSTTGNYNNFFGKNAGYYNIDGSNNNFIGHGAGKYTTTGNYNSFFGNYSGQDNITGSYNLFLGSYTGLSTSSSWKVIIGSSNSGLFDSPDTTKDIQFAVGVKTDGDPSKYWIVGNENFDVGIGATNPTSKLHVDGDVRVTGVVTATSFYGSLVGTSSTSTRATTVDITDTDAQSGNILFSSSGNGVTVYNDTDLTYNSNTNVLAVPVLSATTEVRTSAVKSTNGDAAITISNTTGNVGIASNLTVSGDLFINGNTTQVNTTTLNVKDTLIDLGLVDSGGGVLLPPSVDSNKDIGVLFNYYTGSASKKAAVFWDDSTYRIGIASDVTESSSVIQAGAVYAPIEISELWLNTGCTSNTATRVIGCTGGNLILENVVIDAGTF